MDKAGPSVLAERFPGLPRALVCLVPLGLAGGYAWLRLGDGRFASFHYWCVLLAISSVMLTVFGLFGWLHIRSPERSLGRWSGIGAGCTFFVLVLMGLYLCAQVACWVLNERRAASVKRTGTHSTGENFQINPVLGYMPRPGSEGTARLVVDGEVVFDYQYHTDSLGRRVVPRQAGNAVVRQRALLFFGDSFAFGEGVDDSDTLPNQLAAKVPGVSMYNYAFSGYGPNHMLARLEFSDLRSEIPEPEVAAVYVFIPNHVRRVIGAFSVISWSRNSPYYVFDTLGNTAHLGSFHDGRPRLTRWYDFLKGDHVLQQFAVDLPVRLRPRHLALTAAVIAQSAARFQAAFGSPHFYVVLYPENPEDEFDSRAMAPLLEERGLDVVECSGLLDGPPERYYYMPYDNHPKPETHAILAEKLASRLPFLAGSE